MNKVILYFLFLCIPSRLLLALIAKIIKPAYLPIMGILTSFISIGFLINFINYKKNSKGFFGSKVWWNNYRLVHIFNFGLFSILALLKYNKSWIILLIDALLGLIFFVNKYFI
tara:strand:- start:2925 stop:3263 length:339 start_codon:yes stop_codon:yes gene_type:complete